jgi:hypothetical protein
MANEGSSRARGDEVAPRGELRASYDDRDRVVEALRVAAGDGRITPEELDDRVGAALVARTYGELAALVSDLPAAPGSAAGALAARPQDVVRIVCHSGTARRDGPWLVPQRLEVRVAAGSVTLDFTEAVVSWPSLLIHAEVRGGTLKLVTRPGILVNTDDVEIFGGVARVWAPWGPDMPVRLRIEVSGMANGGSITAGPRRRRRTPWQWLRRRPRRYALPPGPA